MNNSEIKFIDLGLDAILASSGSTNKVYSAHIIPCIWHRNVGLISDLPLATVGVSFILFAGVHVIEINCYISKNCFFFFVIVKIEC